MESIQKNIYGTVNRNDKTIDSVSGETPDNSSEPIPGKTQPIDADALMRRCMGNVEFAMSLLAELESTLEVRVNELKKSMARQDLHATEAAAHALRGATGIVCAESLNSVIEDIEISAKSSDVENISNRISDLTNETTLCIDYLPQLRRDLYAIRK